MRPAASTKRAACLWLPQWPLQRWYSAHPELKNCRALVLYEEHRRGRFQVAACSDSVAALGVRGDMPLAEAKALAEARYEPHDPLADRAALIELAAWCEQFSPLVGIEGRDCLLLDATGLGPLFGSERALAEQIERAFRRRGFLLHVAVADTVGAAWALAHTAEDRVTVLPAGQVPAALALLPPAALRLTDQTVRMLQELGIERVQDLLMLPRDSLASRFEPELLQRLDQATGELAETIHSCRPPPEIIAETLLEFPTDRRATLEIVAAQLLDKVVQSLRARQQGALQLEWQLDCESGPPVRLLVGLYQPSASSRHLEELMRLQWERLWLPGAICAVRLAVLLAAPVAARQMDFLSESHGRNDPRERALLIDRLSSRLGREAVVRAAPMPDAQPEYAYRCEPLAGGQTKEPLQHTRKKPGKGARNPSLALRVSTSPLQRPLWVECEPVAVEALSVVPHGPPFWVRWQGQREEIVRAIGPERIQTGWWRGRFIYRDYYRVETTQGNRYWLFRSNGRWFLHGLFD